MISHASLFDSREKKIIGILAAIQFFHIVDFVIMMPLGPILMRNFAISPQQFSWLVSSYSLAAGFAGLIATFFADRFDRRSVILFCFLGFAVGTFACGFAMNFESLLFCRIFAGSFGGILSSLALAVIGDVISFDKRATATSLVMASFSLASIFGVPAALYLAVSFDWHAPFIAVGVLSFLLMLAVPTFLPPLRGHLSAGKRANIFAPFTALFADRNRQLGLLLQVTMVFGQFTIIPFLSPSLVANTGLLEAQLPFIYLVGGITAIISGPLIGRLADRIGKQRVFRMAVLISLPALFLVTNLPKVPLPVVLLVIAFFFLVVGGRIIPLTAMMTSLVPSSERGAFMSLVSATQQFASSLASLLAGAIIVRDAGTGALLHYSTVGYIAMGFSLLAFILVRFLKTPEEQG